MDHGGPVLAFALAFGAGVLGQAIARHMRLPAIIPLLAIGVFVGPDVIGLIDPRELGGGLFAIVEVAVAIILFEGGLNLEIGRLRRASRPLRRLVTVGALITAAGAAVAARMLMGWQWEPSILFGTLVIVTGPTVIGPLLRNVPVRRRVSTLLEAEGVLIDPVGAIIAAVALQAVVGAHEGLSPGVEGLLVRLGIGTVAGLAGGALVAWLLRLPDVVPDGLENLVALGGALALFASCEAVQSQSGILAVTIAGVVVGNVRTRVTRDLREFQEHLTIGLIGLLFVLLAADVRLVDVFDLGIPGLLTVAVLMLVVRPVNVLVSTAGSDLSFRERAYLGWISPRGIVAAAIASLSAAVLENEGFQGAAELRALVFLTIAVTVVAHGMTAGVVARMLGVSTPRESIGILGADAMGLALGDALVSDGRPVIFFDSNPTHVNAAQDRGFQAVYGNALEERTLARAGMERAAVAIGATPNDEVNSLFAREASQEFGVPETYVAVNRGDTPVSGHILERQASRTLFDRPKDVERWSVRIRHGAATLDEFAFDGVDAIEGDPEPPRSSNGATDPYAVLAVTRGSGPPQPMHVGISLKPGDRAVVAVHEPEREVAEAELAALGWHPALAASDAM